MYSVQSAVKWGLVKWSVVKWVLVKWSEVKWVLVKCKVWRLHRLQGDRRSSTNDLLH